MKTYHLPSAPAAGRRSIQHLLLAAVTVTTLISRLWAQDDFNILANDPESGFKPTILFSETNGDRIDVFRDSGDASFEVGARPGRISAMVVGNLIQFPFTDISEDMPVGVSVGGFEFEATLGDDASRRVDRDGNLMPFDPSKKQAVFFFNMDVPSNNDDGESRTRRVGYVRFTWNTKTVTARILVTNLDGAGVSSVYDRGSLIDAAALDSDRGGLRAFKNEPVDASLTFGSATGVRTVFGAGRVRTRYVHVGSERRGNSDILQRDSILAAGSADITPAKVVTQLPAVDQNSDHVINFNGTIVDLAPSTLTEITFPVSLTLFADGVQLFSDQDTDTPDYFLAMTDPDSNGKSIFTITNLVLPDGSGPHHLVIQAVDVSGNMRQVDTQVADSGLSF